MLMRHDHRTLPFLWRILPVLFLLILLLAAPVTAEEAPPLRKASLMVVWRPQAQFAGYYMAKEKGIYARHGIDATIREGGPAHFPLQALVNEDVDFAVLWLPTALKQQETGPKLAHLAQIVQRSSLMLVTRKTENIAAPADFKGRRVGIWEGELALPVLVFLRKHQLDVSSVTQGYTVNLFLRGGMDAVSATVYNEYHTLLMSGMEPDELTVFSLREHGINVPEDGLYALETRYQQNPALADAFAAASLEGWQYAFDHPEETVDVILRIMRDAKVPASRVHQEWMLEKMRDLSRPDTAGTPMGRLSPDAVETTATLLMDHGFVSTRPDTDTFIK